MAEPRPHIVIGIDFSDASKEAFEAGLAFAGDMGADLVLVHTFPKRLMPTGAAEGRGRALDSLEGELEMDAALELSKKWAKKARDAGFEVETVAQQGHPVDVIVETAKDHKAAAVVIGTHGRSGLKRAVMGSVAEGVLRRATVPVLVVPWSGRRKQT